MAKTTANVKAMRELCGITQQQMADAVGVRVLAVKRWESGARQVPDDVMEWLMRAVADHDAGVAEAISAVAESIGRGAEVVLTYYRTQEQADYAAGDEAAGPYQFLNAIARSAGERLVAMGYRVSFTYPDEERRYTEELM